MKKSYISLFLLQFITFSILNAQSAEPDFMRSIGKIYVVVAVIVAIFLGLVAFLVYLDRRLTKIENQIIKND